MLFELWRLKHNTILHLGFGEGLGLGLGEGLGDGLGESLGEGLGDGLGEGRGLQNQHTQEAKQAQAPLLLLQPITIISSACA